jgi:hypothetical protein
MEGRRRHATQAHTAAHTWASVNTAGHKHSRQEERTRGVRERRRRERLYAAPPRCADGERRVPACSSCVACGSVPDATGCVVHPSTPHAARRKVNSCDQSRPTHHRIPPHTTRTAGQVHSRTEQRPRRREGRKTRE